MAKTMKLEIVSAEKALYSGVVHEVHVPAERGGMKPSASISM